jgi:hypothetical protein
LNLGSLFSQFIRVTQYYVQYSPVGLSHTAREIKVLKYIERGLADLQHFTKAKSFSQQQHHQQVTDINKNINVEVLEHIWFGEDCRLNKMSWPFEDTVETLFLSRQVEERAEPSPMGPSVCVLPLHIAIRTKHIAFLKN